ncbi:unnamed protein product [Boreogadus saida]
MRIDIYRDKNKTNQAWKETGEEFGLPGRHQCVEVFTNALADGELVQKRLEKRPRTLSRAYDIAHSYETTRRGARTVTQFLQPGQRSFGKSESQGHHDSKLGQSIRTPHDRLRSCRASAPGGLAVLGEVNLPVRVGSRATNVNFIMADTAESTEVILGHPFLHQTSAQLDYGRREITLCGEKVPRFNPSHQSRVHVVSGPHNTTVESGCEYVVPGTGDLCSAMLLTET